MKMSCVAVGARRAAGGADEAEAGLGAAEDAGDAICRAAGRPLALAAGAADQVIGAVAAAGRA